MLSDKSNPALTTSAHYRNDNEKEIEILEKSFRDEIWGQRSDIEYKNMLRLAELYEHKKQYQNAIEYFKNVLSYHYLSDERKETIEKKIRFGEKRIAQ
jgi:hypothetical protein